jgi:hypothetical protein
MKKKLLLTLGLVCILTYGSFAQASFAIGLKGGPNFANINTSDAAGTYKSRTGFHVGAFTLIKLTKIGIQPELIFSQQGSKFKYSGSPDLESNFSYINIPVIIKLYTIAGINIQAGPQFGFLTSAKQEIPDPITQQVTKEDVKDAYKKSDVSVALGVGWDLPFGLTIDGRYNLGLSKINDEAGSSAAKNQVWQVSVGYKLIKLGK